MLDGKDVCSEERRRCNAWGKVVLNCGTFNDAHEADRRELIKILTEQSEKNTEVRRLKAMTRGLNEPLNAKPPSKVSAVVSAFSPAALGLGQAIEAKPRSSLLSNGIKKAFEFLNPSPLRHSIT
jgi:hypothetical protein